MRAIWCAYAFAAPYGEVGVIGVDSSCGVTVGEPKISALDAWITRTGDPVRSVAVPLNGVVREGDGTMTVWVTTDRRHFVKRTVKIGLQRDGYHQILEGIAAGELAATDGAVFLSNALRAAAR